MNLYAQYDNNYYIHWTIVIAIYLITILFALCDCKENFTDKRGDTWHYQFYPNTESLGGDLYHRPDLAGNIEELKKVCQNDPYCRGFNTDGWFKKTISSQDQWWVNTNSNIGLYVRLPGVRRDSPYPSMPFPGTHIIG